MAQAAINYSTIYFDNVGKPYWMRADGTKVYLAPLVAAQSQDPRAKQWAQSMGVVVDPDGRVAQNDSAPGGSYFKERGHWNAETGQWDQDTDWENIIGTSLAALPLAAGGAAALGGGSTPAAAGSSSQAPLASSTIPNAHLAVPTTAGMVSQGVSQTVPSVPRFGNGGGTPPGGGSFLDRITDFATDPSKLAGLAALIPGLATAFGGGGGNSASEDALLDEAREGMALQRGRIQQTQPVFDTLVRMSYGNSPTRHRSETPPAGYQGPPSGYRFTPPRFGDR
jgi:hypothetical protein